MHRRRNRKQIRQQEKVVFLLDPNSQNRKTNKADETYNYVRDMVEIMLRKSAVATDVVFIGGGKRELCMWITGVLKFYQYSQITMQDNTHLFELDPDFDLPDNYR
jgi:heptaprenylglyceryl phosphate synthase